MTLGRFVRRLIAAVIAAVVLIWIAVVMLVVAEGRGDEARAAAAIVVMGAAQYDGRPSPVLRARLDHALELWRRGMAPKLVLTGGRGIGDTLTEAEVGRRYVMRRGVPDSAILVETEGRTTIQSLRGVSALLNPPERPAVIVVSDPFHMLRLSILARRLGFEPLSSPTRTSPISRHRWQRWRYVLGESFKVPVAFLLER